MVVAAEEQQGIWLGTQAQVVKNLPHILPLLVLWAIGPLVIPCEQAVWYLPAHLKPGARFALPFNGALTLVPAVRTRHCSGLYPCL